eukprot:3071565-Pleurochrysis_carterae.AAC.1
MLKPICQRDRRYEEPAPGRGQSSLFGAKPVLNDKLQMRNGTEVGACGIRKEILILELKYGRFCSTH